MSIGSQKGIFNTAVTQKCPGRLGDPRWPRAQLTPGPWDNAVLGVGWLLRQEPARRGHGGDTEGLPVCVGLGVLSPKHSGIWRVGVPLMNAHLGLLWRVTPAFASQQSSSPFSSSFLWDCFFSPIIRLPWRCSSLPVGPSRAKEAGTSHQCISNRSCAGPTLQAGPTASAVSKLQSQHPATHQAAGRCLPPACSGQSPRDPPASCPCSNPLLRRAPSPSSPLQSFGKGHSAPQPPAPTPGGDQSN